MDIVPEDWRNRQRITLTLAGEFLRRHATRRCRFEPVGAAQGWSPRSFAESVTELQAMGYRHVALGGMAYSKNAELLACLEGVNTVRHPETQLHIFGVKRPELVPEFRRFGVTSFDSTSPLKQAFMDDKDNYYAPGRTYIALRVPQVGENARLKKRIGAGQVDQAEAVRLERRCLEALLGYDAYPPRATLDDALSALRAYEQVHDGKRDRTAAYRETLTDRPWRDCDCVICRRLGIQVIIFRGAERNRRRGFHNLQFTYRQLLRALGQPEETR